MDKSFKNKNLLVIVFEIVVIILGIIGITYATTQIINNRTVTNLTVGEYTVEYIGDKNVTVNNLEPIDDNLVNINTKDKVIRLEFSLRGAVSNKKDDLIYDVMIKNLKVDCAFLNKYTKWVLYKNGNKLSTGSLDPAFDGDALGDTMRLTNIQEDLPSHNDKYDKYVVIFWISESCDDISSCELIDQSNIVDKSVSMEVFIAVNSGEKKAFERVPNYDNSCANRPRLYNNMIPVTYKDGNFVLASSSNSDKNYLWYDYNKQQWANALVVKDKSKYRNVGDKIDSSSILGYYVWIPRYSYKLWNATGDGSDSYKAYDEGIDIKFEGGLNNVSGTENNTYITHPAFGNDSYGFWISKYEISKNGDNYLSVPNAEAYVEASLENYQKIFNNLGSTYKLGDNAVTEMVTNLQWGAVLYLSHSKYGVCFGDGCSSIGINDSYKAGYNRQDTTTRNVYGVYDMAGGAAEYVMGKSNQLGCATKEVTFLDGDTWYQGHGLASERDYVIRGGIGKGLFNFRDIGMSDIKVGSRSIIREK